MKKDASLKAYSPTLAEEVVFVELKFDIWYFKGQETTHIRKGDYIIYILLLLLGEYLEAGSTHRYYIAGGAGEEERKENTEK